MLSNLKDLNLKDKEKELQISGELRCLLLNETNISRIRTVFENEMELALSMTKSSSLQMENTYIPELPDGTENGDFLAVDLGGTNLRVMLLALKQGMIISEVVKHYPIPENLRIGCGETLFDYLAKCIDEFANEQKLCQNFSYPLGFTFSFPMRQNGLDSGVLVTWTKTFNCPSVVGEDAVCLLRKSLEKLQRTNIEIVAILNDTTGTLMHGAYLDRRCRIGIVLGTGSNGCYMESADRVKHWEQQRHGEKHVIIDIEWGAFGDNGVLNFIKTKFDKLVDETSLMRGSFTFEKYISGKYLGELSRVILEHLHGKGLFMKQLEKKHFPKPWTFDSDNISKIEFDTLGDKGDNETVLQILYSHFHAKDIVDDDDVEILRFVCGLISLRAAQLVAIVTSVLLNRMEDDDISIAIDGSVYKHHPRLRRWINQYTSKWAPNKKSHFMLAEDGSGKGAALVAAIADKIQKREN